MTLNFARIYDIIKVYQEAGTSMAKDIYLEAESENYHIIFCDPESTGELDPFSEKAFIHLKSKKHRTILPFTKVSGVANAPRDYIEKFFETSQKLEGQALDDHLSRFMPLHFMDDKVLGNYEKFGKNRDAEGDKKGALCLVDVLNTYFGEKPSINDWIKLRHLIESMEVTPHQNFAKNETLSVIQDQERSQAMFLESNLSYSHLATTSNAVYMKLSRGLDKLGLYDLNETSQELREILGRIYETARLPHSLDKIWTHLTAPHLGDELPGNHPAREGLYQMAFGDNPHLSREEVIASGVLDGSRGYGDRPDHWAANIDESHSDFSLGKRGNMSKLLNFMMGNDPIEQRNAFQTMSRFDFDPGMLQSRSFSHKKLEDYRDTIMQGENPSKLLHKVIKEYLERDITPEYTLIKDKFGKKDFNILANNIVAQNRIVHAGKPGTFFTLEGESLTVEPYSREEVKEHADEWNAGSGLLDTRFMAKATLKNEQGDVVFSGPLQHSKLTLGMGAVIADMPKGMLTKPQHLLALEHIQNSDKFKKKIISGFMMLRDGGLKKASEYRGVWDSLIAGIDRTLDGSEPYADASVKLADKKPLEKYSQTSYVDDGENIMHTITSALTVHYLREAGIDIESKFKSLEHLTENMSSGDLEFIMSDDNFNVGDGCQQHSLTSALSVKYPSINQVINISDKLHKGYSSLISEAGPDIEASWPPSLPEISIPLPSGRVATLRALDNYMDIRREGRTQDHCLASYSTRCLRREYEAFQVLVDGEPTATLGMECDGEGLVFDQLQGFANSAVDPELDKAVREFAEEIENEGEYDGHEVSIEQANNQNLKLTESQLISLQLDLNIDSPTAMATCREFLVDRIGDETTKAIIHKGIQAAYDHYEESYKAILDDWEEGYGCEDMKPEPPIEYEHIEMAREAMERDFNDQPGMNMR